jgi:hypothetical protein
VYVSLYVFVYVCARAQVCFRVCMCVLLSSYVRMCVLPMRGYALVCA